MLADRTWRRIMFNYLGVVYLHMGLFDRKREDEGGVSETSANAADFGSAGDSYARTSPQEGSAQNPQARPGDASAQGGADNSLGIRDLMDKRTKLENAVDYVGVMITNLRDKRTGLEKEIEDESVEIKNIHEKLVKVQEYIDTERQGIELLKKRRAVVDAYADEATERMSALHDLISDLDVVVKSELENTRSYRESKTPDGARTS